MIIWFAQKITDELEYLGIKARLTTAKTRASFAFPIELWSRSAKLDQLSNKTSSAEEGRFVDYNLDNIFGNFPTYSYFNRVRFLSNVFHFLMTELHLVKALTIEFHDATQLEEINKLIKIGKKPNFFEVTVFGLQIIMLNC